MGAAFLIGLREGVEAALVVGIVLGALTRLGQLRFRRHVWLGAGTAALLSSAVGIALYSVGVSFTGRAEQIFEGTTMLLAAALLTWMIFWMKTHGRALALHLEEETREAVTVGGLALFGVAFFAVLREGLETALFLVAAAFQTRTLPTLGGGLAGLAAAILIGVFIFRASQQMNLRTFFNVTGLLLLLVAAGLLAHSIHEFQETGLLPVFIEHVWDINPVLDENSTVGMFLKALFGYNGNPSLLEVLVYLVYLVVIGITGKPRDVQVRRLLA